MSVVAKLLAAGTALALGILLVSGFFMWLGPFEGWGVLALFVAVPAAMVALMPFRARIFCFGLGVLAVAGTALLDTSGPDNSMQLLPLAAISVAVAAAVAELSVRASRRLLRRRIVGSGMG